MTAPDLTDPVTVHANMLRGTIAKPTIEQIVHLYGVDALVAALAPVIVREAGIEPVAALEPAPDADPVAWRWESCERSQGWNTCYGETEPKPSPYISDVTPLYAAPQPAPDPAAIREAALREAAAIAQGYHDRAIEWAKTVRGLEQHIGETDSSRIAAAILALIQKGAAE